MHFRCLKKCKIQQNYNYKHQSCNICNEGSKTDGFVPPSLQVILLQKIKLWCMLCSYKTTNWFGYLRTSEDRGKKHFRIHFESLKWFTWKSSYIWWYWNLKARRTEHEWGEIQYGGLVYTQENRFNRERRTQMSSSLELPNFSFIKPWFRQRFWPWAGGNRRICSHLFEGWGRWEKFQFHASSRP